MFLPLKSSNVFSDKSEAVSVKSGAWLPTVGSAPIVCNGVPFKCTVAIIEILDYKNTLFEEDQKKNLPIGDF
jgi:hypothetical protein